MKYSILLIENLMGLDKLLLNLKLHFNQLIFPIFYLRFVNVQDDTSNINKATIKPTTRNFFCLLEIKIFVFPKEKYFEAILKLF